MTRPSRGARRRSRARARRHPGPRRRRQDGADARAHGEARGAGPARDRRGALLREGLAREARRPGRRMHRLRPARSRGAGAPAARAEPRLHGRAQVRRGGQCTRIHLGDERARSLHGGRHLPRLAHRGVLDRLRLPVRRCRRPRAPAKTRRRCRRPGTTRLPASAARRPSNTAR